MTDDTQPRYFYFDVKYAVNTHDWIIEISGGLTGTKDIGQLESPLEHIQNDWYYPEIEDKLTHLVFPSIKTMPSTMEINALHWRSGPTF